MATLNAEHINPFLLAAKKVLQETCFVDVTINRPGVKEASFSADTWVIMVGVTGDMRGQVFLSLPEKDACAIASKMCMMEIKEIDDFAASALSELGNMIMGNAATVFSSNGVGIDITPPSLSHGDVEFNHTYSKTLFVPLSFDNVKVEMYLALVSNN